MENRTVWLSQLALRLFFSEQTNMTKPLTLRSEHSTGYTQLDSVCSCDSQKYHSDSQGQGKPRETRGPASYHHFSEQIVQLVFLSKVCLGSPFYLLSNVFLLCVYVLFISYHRCKSTTVVIHSLFSFPFPFLCHQTPVMATSSACFVGLAIYDMIPHTALYASSRSFTSNRSNQRERCKVGDAQAGSDGSGSG